MHVPSGAIRPQRTIGLRAIPVTGQWSDTGITSYILWIRPVRTVHTLMEQFPLLQKISDPSLLNRISHTSGDRLGSDCIDLIPNFQDLIHRPVSEFQSFKLPSCAALQMILPLDEKMPWETEVCGCPVRLCVLTPLATVGFQGSIQTTTQTNTPVGCPSTIQQFCVLRAKCSQMRVCITIPHTHCPVKSFETREGKHKQRRSNRTQIGTLPIVRST